MNAHLYHFPKAQIFSLQIPLFILYSDIPCKHPSLTSQADRTSFWGIRLWQHLKSISHFLKYEYKLFHMPIMDTVLFIQYSFEGLHVTLEIPQHSSWGKGGGGLEVFSANLVMMFMMNWRKMDGNKRRIMSLLVWRGIESSSLCSSTISFELSTLSFTFYKISSSGLKEEKE